MSRKTEARPTRSETAAADGEGFVGRWSRLKARHRRDPEPVVPQAPPAVTAPEPTPVLTDRDMPPIESLDADSDYSGFLSPGVSEDLRRQALRKLFKLSTLDKVCELDSEYMDCHGYTPLGGVLTHEMRAQLEREARELKERVVDAALEPAEAPQRAEPVAPVTTSKPSVPAQSARTAKLRRRPAAKKKES